METKICGWCKDTKNISEFAPRKKNGRVGTRRECKECGRKRQRERYIKNPEIFIKRNMEYEQRNKEKVANKRKEWHDKNEDKRKERRKYLYTSNAEVIRAKRKEYYYKNKESCIKSVNSYVENNKAKVRARQRANHAKRKSSDIGYSILKVLRTRVTAAIKNKGRKCKKTMELVGCPMSVLISHLESKFTIGMDWSNYGFKGWHVDHIKPCASFDMSDLEEQKKCFNYTNLQPLWWYDNMEKGAKII